MQLQQPPCGGLLRAASPPSSSPATALQRRRAAGSARPARGCLSAAASSSAWQGELVTLFGWEAAERAAGEASGSGGDSRPPPTVLLDGANLLWAYGHAVSKRFGCKIYPSAAGLLLALDYEAWRSAGVRVTAVLPEDYVHGSLRILADGCGGDTRFLQPALVSQGKSGSWTNLPLAAAVAAGRIRVVKRTKGMVGRGDDDREIIRRARMEGAFVCSNDLYREHCKLTGGAEARRPGCGESHMFRNHKRFVEWSRERRFGCTFGVALGLDDALLLAMAAASSGGEVTSPEQLRPRLKEAPWSLPIPVSFQPTPGEAMLACYSALRRRAEEAPVA